MATPTSIAFPAVASGAHCLRGRVALPPAAQAFDSLAIASEDVNSVPYTTPGQIMVFTMHGSGGSNFTIGRQYLAQVSGSMVVDTFNTFSFYTVRSSPSNIYLLRPNNNFVGASPREDFYIGYVQADGKVHLTTQRRHMALIDWAKANISVVDWSKTCCQGGSMGGWGTMTTGMRRGDFFAALYPDRPRWRYCNTVGSISIPIYGAGNQNFTVANSPLLAAEDGGGKLSDWLDFIAYVSNTANKIPWVGWNVGWMDGYTPRQDHIDAVAAMRAAKRGFAFAWINASHDDGSIIAPVQNSYPFGTFALGKGYPLFTSFSRDQDPATTMGGGINIDLSFRNVVETASGWSCEITCVTATTVNGITATDLTGDPAGGSTTTSIEVPRAKTDRTDVIGWDRTDVFVGSTLTINGETRNITAYDGGTFTARKHITLDAPLSSAPAKGAAFVINRPPSCTVDVEPISSVFTKAVAKKTVTIPAANSWVAVSFN